MTSTTTLADRADQLVAAAENTDHLTRGDARDIRDDILRGDFGEARRYLRELDERCTEMIDGPRTQAEWEAWWQLDIADEYRRLQRTARELLGALA